MPSVETIVFSGKRLKREVLEKKKLFPPLINPMEADAVNVREEKMII